jgi:hypothetical protein
MFFNKKPEQAASAAPKTLEWEQGSRRSQSTRVIISSWFIKTTPMLKYPAGCKVEITFEGRARLGTTPGVPVYGEIEIPIDVEPPAMLSDYWKHVPECVNGYTYMSTDAGPQMFLSLYCTAAAIEWVHRVCTAGFSNVGCKVALDINLGYPDDMGQDFWTERWLREKLLVHTWDVRASGDRNPE